MMTLRNSPRDFLPLHPRAGGGGGWDGGVGEVIFPNAFEDLFFVQIVEKTERVFKISIKF
jgi:hypothetical protein